MSSSLVSAQEGNLQEQLHIDAMRGRWSKVYKKYKQERALRTAQIMGTGNTVLHVAVSSGQEKVVANMVGFLVGLASRAGVEQAMEDGDNVDIVLGIENDERNTPLHLAATLGNVEMCKKMGCASPSLIARRNIAGETPLFLAALSGKKKAFLWLHYLYMDSPGVSSANFAHCRRDNDDTILHCAIAEGHIDVAIEIVHLYKNHLKEMMMRNEEGLSPLHLLAANCSAFKSTALFVHPLYWFIWVRKKKQATTKDELKRRELNPCGWAFMNVLYNMNVFNRDDEEGSSFVAMIEDIIVNMLGLSTSFLLNPLGTLKNLFVSGENQENILAITFVVNILSWTLLFPLLIQLFPYSVAVRWLQQIQKMKEKHIWSLQIMNELLQHASDEDMSQTISRTAAEHLSISLQTDEDNGSEPMAMRPSGTITIETPLMIAVKNGVIELVEKILELFPSRIKDVNTEGKNIVLLAVQYRQTYIYRFLCKQKWLTESLFRQVDKEGNNALHFAARLGMAPDWLNPGEALSIIREINWFKFVKKSMPHDLLERYNRKMETPEDIFRESHEELMKSEAKWVVKTSQACSVVSTLVASVAFATRTSVPGGYDHKGYAILRNKSPVAFKIFVWSSFVALFFSLISTIFFLSIAASRSQSLRSWRYTLFKLYYGMSSMFFSIVGLWISFCAGGFFMLDDESQKLRYVLPWYICMSVLIILYAVTQLPTFLGPALPSIFPIPAPRRKATHPIEYQRAKNNENRTDLNRQN